MGKGIYVKAGTETVEVFVAILKIIALVVMIAGFLYGSVCLVTWVAETSIVLAIIVLVLLTSIIVFCLIVAEKKVELNKIN